MNPVWTITRNDFHRRLRAPAGLILFILIPVIMTGLIGTVFSPKKTVLPRIPILVADQDGGFVSRFLLQAFSAGESRKMFVVETVPEPEGIKRLAADRASALLVIPEGFSDRLLKIQSVRLRLVKNPSQQHLPIIAEEFVNTLSLGLSAIFWVFQDEIQAFRPFLVQDFSLISAASLTPFLEKARVKFIAVRSLLDPLLIDLKKEAVKKPGLRYRELSIFAWLFPGMAVMFLLFIMQSVLEDLLLEKERGTLRRILFSAIAPRQYILGKVIGGFLVGFFGFWVMIFACAFLFSLRFARWDYILLLVTVVCAFAAAFFAMTHALVRTRRHASMVNTPVILVFSVLGGSMLPIEQLGKGMQALSRFTPNYWFITGTHQAMRGTFPGPALLVLTVFAAVCFAVAFFLLKKRL